MNLQVNDSEIYNKEISSKSGLALFNRIRTDSFKVFYSIKELEDLIKYFEKWEIKLTEEEKYAVKTYVNGNFDDINLFLRENLSREKIMEIDYKYSRELKKASQLIHEALIKAVVPEAITVYRGTTKDVIYDKTFEHPRELIGMVIQDKGFISTSLIESACWRTKNKPVIMSINLPKGIHAAYISQTFTRNFDDELELLIDRNKYMIITDAYYKDSKLKIECEIIK